MGRIRNEMTALFDRPITAASDMAYAVGTLPSSGKHAVKYEIIEIKSHLRHKLHNKYETYQKFRRLIFFSNFNS